jgi:hypothetical protein
MELYLHSPLRLHGIVFKQQIKHRNNFYLNYDEDRILSWNNVKRLLCEYDDLFYMKQTIYICSEVLTEMTLYSHLGWTQCAVHQLEPTLFSTFFFSG